MPDVAVLGMPDFVAEDGINFIERKFLENAISENDVSYARDETDDHGVGRGAVCRPEEEVGAVEMEPLGSRFQSLADWTRRHRFQSQDGLDEQWHKQDQHRNERNRGDPIPIRARGFRKESRDGLIG